jgi:prepilin-type N-terminal cleavage/methylation domain-containing protein
MKKSFTLVEILMVVAILGILAAIILPTLQSNTTKAKESTAKDNLRILRNAIELYAAQHNEVSPGYLDGDVNTTPLSLIFIRQLCLVSNKSGQTSTHPAAGFDFGPYINKFPENPFNNDWVVKMVGNTEEFPSNATGNFAYVYKPATKVIKLDWPGTDSEGVLYYDY